MPTAFPLFSLPYLPFKAVLNNFEPQGVFNISLCSRKSKSVAVSHRGCSKDVQLDLRSSVKHGLVCCKEGIDYWLVHVVKTSELPEDRTLSTVKIGAFDKIPVEMGMMCQMTCLKTYWEDRMVGLIEIGKYAREIFNRDIYIAMLGKEQSKNDHRRAVDWLLGTQKSIDTIYCEFTPRTDDDFEYLLEKCKIARDFSFCVKPSDGFFPAKIHYFNNDSLYLESSSWIKKDNLLNMNCKNIMLSGSKLTYQDINTFLKHWKFGGCFRLKKFNVWVGELIDYEVVLNGLDYSKKDNEEIRNYESEYDYCYTIKGGFDIKRSMDNITATILNDGANSGGFRMLVWPDFDGNFY